MGALGWGSQPWKGVEGGTHTERLRIQVKGEGQEQMPPKEVHISDRTMNPAHGPVWPKHGHEAGVGGCC